MIQNVLSSNFPPPVKFSLISVHRLFESQGDVEAFKGLLFSKLLNLLEVFSGFVLEALTFSEVKFRVSNLSSCSFFNTNEFSLVCSLWSLVR